MRGRPARLTGVQALQVSTPVGLSTTHKHLEQRQQPQRQRQQGRQPDDLVVAPHPQWADPQRPILQQVEIPLQRPPRTIAHHGFAQRESFHRDVGDLETPAVTTTLTGDRLAIAEDLDDHVPHLGLRTRGSVRPTATGADVGGPGLLVAAPADPEQAGDFMTPQDRGDGGLQRRRLVERAFAPAGWRCQQAEGHFGPP
jgi:hypothetical protein